MPVQTHTASNVRRLASATTALPADVTPPGAKGGILNVALRLFAEQGYAGASIRDIAQACDLKPASIYAHYASKEKLLAQLLNLGHEEHFKMVQEAVIDAEPEPFTQLKAYVSGHVRVHAEFPMLATLVNHELHALSADEVTTALKLREQATNVLMRILKRGQEQGVFANDFDHWLAGAAIGAMGMRVANWYSEQHEKTIEEIVDHYQRFACRLVGTGEKLPL